MLKNMVIDQLLLKLFKLTFFFTKKIDLLIDLLLTNANLVIQQNYRWSIFQDKEFQKTHLHQ